MAMRTPCNRNSIPALLSIAAAIANGACKSRAFNDDGDGAREQAPANQPISFKIAPTTSCDVASGPADLVMKHPITGKDITINYKSSDQVEYLTKGWESRIGITPDFFSSKNLNGYDSSEVKVTVVDIRNVNGKPAYHYFSNGTHEQTFQNWSSTKFMGASFGIHNIRVHSGGTVGADVRNNGRVLASDLDVIGEASDNGYAISVKQLGGHRNADMMLENWLLAGKRVPRDDNAVSLDTFGGAWGSNSDPCGGPLPQPSVTDITTGKVVNLPARGGNQSTRNLISALTYVEWLKRLAVNERDPDTMPKLIDYGKGAPSPAQVRAAKNSLTKRDLEILFYGSAAYTDREFIQRGLDKSDCGGTLGSTFSESGGQPRGGMMWDGLRDWPHTAGGTSTLTKVFGPNWRTLGKGGSGGSDEAAIGYMCFPKTASFPGREMVVHLHYRNTKGRGQPKYAHMHKAAEAVFEQMVPGLRSGAPRDMGTGSSGGGGGGSGLDETPGKAVSKQDTVIKTSPADSSTLGPDEKCSLASGSTLVFKAKATTEERGHTKIRLDPNFASGSCPNMKREIYIFTQHFKFEQ